MWRNYGNRNRGYGGRRRYYPRYRQWDFFDDLPDECEDRERKPTVKKIAEFKVKPIFDHIYPRHEIRIETKTYFGYIPLRLRDGKRAEIAEIVAMLTELFSAKVAFIKEIPEHGDPKMLFTADEATPPPADFPKPGFFKMIVNKRDVFRLPISRVKDPTADEIKGKLKKLNVFFSDSIGNDIERYYAFYSCREEKLVRIRKGSHFDPIAPTVIEKESGLEKFLEDALCQNKIAFEKQKKILFNGQVLTIADFYRPNERIALFCDGFDYHSSSQKMNVDRKQDRILQNLGYVVLRFTDSEIENDIASVIHEIQETIRIRGKEGSKGIPHES